MLLHKLYQNGDLRVILSNSSLLMVSSFLISLVGSIYWWLAARYFSAHVIGLASVALSIMLLLGTIGTLGLGTLLVEELHGRPLISLIGSALVITTIASGILGGVAALLTQTLTSSESSFCEQVFTVGLFAVGVSLTGLTLVLDKALVGLLHTKLQLLRNGIFAFTKLLLLLLFGVWIVEKSNINNELLIYSSWVIGHIVALGCLGLLASRAGIQFSRARPQFRTLQKLTGRSLQHHTLNLILQVPDFLMPLLVALLLSPTSAGYFYIVSKIAALLWTIPYALSRILFAMSVRHPQTLGENLRQTLGISFFGGVIGNLVLLFGGNWLLSLFGYSYVEHGVKSLQLLGLAIFPLTIKEHYIVIARIQQTYIKATWSIAAATVFQLTAAVIGGQIAGLEGMLSTWLMIVIIEMGILCPTVFKALRV